jgi:hypothetical protein
MSYPPPGGTPPPDPNQGSPWPSQDPNPGWGTPPPGPPQDPTQVQPPADAWGAQQQPQQPWDQQPQGYDSSGGYGYDQSYGQMPQQSGGGQNTGLIVGLISDLCYVWVDPRIDFESRET